MMITINTGISEVGELRRVDRPVSEVKGQRLRYVERESSIPTSVQAMVLANVSIQRVVDTLRDKDRYDEDEPKPTNATVHSCRDFLSCLGENGVVLPELPEVGTFYGELSLTWRHQDRKLTFIFPGHTTSGLPSLYHERLHAAKPLGDYGIDKEIDPLGAAKWFDWLIKGTMQERILF